MLLLYMDDTESTFESEDNSFLTNVLLNKKNINKLDTNGNKIEVNAKALFLINIFNRYLTRFNNTLNLFVFLIGFNFGN